MSEKQFKATIRWSQIFILGAILGIMAMGIIAILFLNSKSPEVPVIGLSAMIGGALTSTLHFIRAA